MASVEASLKAEQSEQAHKRRKELRSTVRVQGTGTALFVIGALLSAGGNLLPC